MLQAKIENQTHVATPLANVLEVTEIIKPNKEIYKQNLENKNKD